MDLSEKMLQQARAFQPGVKFRRGNILALDFADDSIGGIVAFYAVVHFNEEQVEQALNEVFRVLQPGGIFLLTFHIGAETIRLEEFLGKKTGIDFIFFSKDFICGSLKKTGFIDIELIEREPYPEVEYPSRRAYVFAHKSGRGP